MVLFSFEQHYEPMDLNLQHISNVSVHVHHYSCDDLLPHLRQWEPLQAELRLCDLTLIFSKDVQSSSCVCFPPQIQNQPCLINEHRFFSLKNGVHLHWKQWGVTIMLLFFLLMELVCCYYFSIILFFISLQLVVLIHLWRSTGYSSPDLCAMRARSWDFCFNSPKAYRTEPESEPRLV